MNYKSKACWVEALMVLLANGSSGVSSAQYGSQLANLRYFVYDKGVQAFQYNVAFEMIIENESSQGLNLTSAAYVRGDNLDHETGRPWTMPTRITPQRTEGFVGHKVGNTATGCAGTISYKIGDTRRIFTIMYSVPYSHDFYSNWLGFWIHGENEFDADQKEIEVVCETGNNCARSVVTLGYGSNAPSSSANLFNKIYYDGKGKIAEYYNTLPTLQYQSGGFRVEGSMGSSHKPQINIKFSGINESPTSRG